MEIGFRVNSTDWYARKRMLCTHEYCAHNLLVDIWGGWACFTISILMIGVLTAIIGDLASQVNKQKY